MIIRWLFPILLVLGTEAVIPSQTREKSGEERQVDKSCPAGAPCISSVTGTLTKGNEITVHGIQLMNLGIANWDPWVTNTRFSFEGSSPSADGWVQQGGNNVNGTYVTNVALIGRQSAHFAVSWRGGGSCPAANRFSAMYPSGVSTDDVDDYYAAAYVRYEAKGGQWPSDSIKYMHGQGKSAQMQYYFQPGNGPALPSFWTAVHDGISHPTDNPSGQLRSGRWYHTEVHWKTTGGNLFTAYVDGHQVYKGVPVGTHAAGILLIGAANACGTNAYDIDINVDGFSLSKSPVGPASTIEITNGPTYETAKKVWQAPTRISETEVRFTFDLSGNNRIRCDPTCYVFVTDNQRNRSNGYAITP